MHIEDRIIIDEIKKGNKQVYQALFKDYYLKLVGFAKGYLFDQLESEDLVQELFIYIWENSHKIKISTSIKSYFYQSIKNRCLNRLRDQKVMDNNHLLYMEGIMNSEDEIQYFDSKLLKSVIEAIDELPEQMASVFRMKMFDGESRETIAQELGISVNTVKTQLYRAKTRLREQLLTKTNLFFIL